MTGRKADFNETSDIWLPGEPWSCPSHEIVCPDRPIGQENLARFKPSNLTVITVHRLHHPVNPLAARWKLSLVTGDGPHFLLQGITDICHKIPGRFG